MKSIRGAKMPSDGRPLQYYPFFEGRHWISMIHAYFDESYNSQIFAIGGWMAPAPAWEAFSKDWSFAIRQMGISSFHMADFENDQQDFKGWKAAGRHLPAIQELIGIIKRHHLVGFGAAIVISAYDELITDFLKSIFPSPYFVCFNSCFAHTSAFVKKVAPEMRAAFYFDQSNEFSAHAVRMYHTAVTRPRISDITNVDGLTFANRRTMVGLQAADILAYEILKRATHREFEPNRPVRRSLIELLPLLYQARFYNREVLATLIEETLKGWDDIDKVRAELERFRSEDQV